MPFRKSIAQASLEALSLLARRVNREIPRLCECKFERRFVRKTKRKSTPKRSKIEHKSVQNRPPERPRSHRGPSFAQERKKALQEGPQAAPRTPLGAHKGVPRATKAAQRAPRGGQRARQRDLGRGKIDHKSTSEAKKVKFAKSALRLGPADVPGTSPPPRSTPNRHKLAPSRSLEPQHGPQPARRP